MPTEWIVKKLRQGMFSDTLMQMAADKIEELENKLAELQTTQLKKAVVNNE